MMQISNMFLTIGLFFLLLSCKTEMVQKTPDFVERKEEGIKSNILPAADRPNLYLPLLRDKKVGLVINQTSRVGDQHLLDFLLDEKIAVQKLFAPEHGFRGKADAGEKINSEVDEKTGLEIVSLYGKNKKPKVSDLKELDVVIFDIQDVGVRFYTYLSTLHYVMEACAENNIPLIVLDRPNPNGHYIDGPIMEEEHMSFVGLHPVPIVYGMTIGEYGKMINGEAWLKDGVQCDLKVIPIKNYIHSASYDLPVKPSPNLPNRRSILLYPSLCFFEGTTFSIGRGTIMPFQLLGHPRWMQSSFAFTPKSGPGAKYPKHENKTCGGLRISTPVAKLEKLKKVDLSYLINAYALAEANDFDFFNDNNFFEKLTGTDQLRKQLKEGVPEEQIRESWKKGLHEFRKVRARYLIY